MAPPPRSRSPTACHASVTTASSCRSNAPAASRPACSMHAQNDVQLSFDLNAAPDGLVYLPEFVSAEEERALVAAMETIEWHAVVMHGQAAKRTVAHFGVTYGYSTWRLEDAPPMPS